MHDIDDKQPIIKHSMPETANDLCEALHVIAERPAMKSDGFEVFLSRTTLRQIEIMSGLRLHGSMSKAAEELGMSVANVSRVSKRFEANLNVKLFEGDGRRLCLRTEGEKILDHLLPLTREIVALRDHLKSMHELSGDS